MDAAIHPLPQVEWPYFDILVRLALALALGLLIGLERERRGKEAGLRTFGFIALMGALSGSLGVEFALLALLLVALLCVFLNLHAMRTDQGTELTTSTAMLVTCLSGVLCGQGHRLTPAAVMVITTALLAWKQPLSGFSAGLTENELRSALILAILAIVIYPALPEGAIGPLGLIEPRAAWLTVLVIASIGFVNYILWKIYRSRGLELTGFFGGLVNSSVTVNEIVSRTVAANNDAAARLAYRAILLATAAMLIRNGVLLVILMPQVFMAALVAHAAMLLGVACLVVCCPRPAIPATSPPDATAEIGLDLPFSLWSALKYGAVFLALHVFGVLAQQYGGHGGFYVVSFLGGLVSSASAVAAAASLAESHSITPAAAGIGAVIASLTSVVVNLPFVLRAHNRRLTSLLLTAIGVIVLIGIAAILFMRALPG